jgi:hypothetical protein
MTFDEAKALALAGNDIRHPNMPKGYVIRKTRPDSDLLYWGNPFNNSSGLYTPTEEDRTRTDWTAGQGLAAL